MPRGSFNKRSVEPIQGAGGFTNLVTAFDPYFNALASNQTVGAPASADLATITTSVTTQTNRIQVWSSFCVQLTAAGSARLFIEVDAVQKVAELVTNAHAVAALFQGAINWSQTVTAGAHTIKLRTTVAAGTLFCRPVAVPNEEFANLTVNVLNIGV